MAHQRPAVGEATRRRAQIGAERRDHRPVGRRRVLAGAATEDEELALDQCFLSQACLANARFAREKDQPARPVLRRREQTAELSQLAITSDQRSVSHAISPSRTHEALSTMTWSPDRGRSYAVWRNLETAHCSS